MVVILSRQLRPLRAHQPLGRYLWDLPHLPDHLHRAVHRRVVWWTSLHRQMVRHLSAQPLRSPACSPRRRQIGSTLGSCARSMWIEPLWPHSSGYSQQPCWDSRLHRDRSSDRDRSSGCLPARYLATRRGLSHRFAHRRCWQGRLAQCELYPLHLADQPYWIRLRRHWIRRHYGSWGLRRQAGDTTCRHWQTTSRVRPSVPSSKGDASAWRP